MNRQGLRISSLALAGAIALVSGASSTLADVRTYTIPFFPEEPVTNHMQSLQFDPRLVEPFLRGATIVSARVIVEFTPSNGFNPAELNLSMLVPHMDGNVVFLNVNGGEDLGWTTPPTPPATAYTANFTTSMINGVITDSPRAPWFWDLTGSFENDPPVFSGAFNATSRVEFDYLPLPQAIVTTGDLICPGDGATLTVRASCADPAPAVPTYQWQVIGGPGGLVGNWTPLTAGDNSFNGQFVVNATGVATDALTVTRAGNGGWPTAPGSEFYFRCVVTTAECGPIESAEATPPVSVGTPAFTEIAFPFTTCVGGTASLNVFPEGVPPFTFAWRKNGVAIDPVANPSAIEPVLNLGTLGTDSSATYDCLVTDACATTASLPVSVTVCIADFDCMGTVAIDDVFSYLNAWFANDPRADINSGGLSVQDIFDFLNAWFTGC